MTASLRILAAALLAALVLGVAVPTAWAQDEQKKPKDPDRASPRAVFFQGFLQPMKDATQRDKPERIEDALESLDTSQLRGTEKDRREQAERLAHALYDVMNYQGRLDALDFPKEHDEDYWALETRFGDIGVHLTDQVWRFTPDTLARVELMSKEYERIGAERYQALTLRPYMPEALTGQVYLFEHWQWLGIVILLLACWMVNKVVGFIGRRVIAGILRKRHWLAHASRAAEAASGPMGLFAVAMLIFIGGPMLDLPDDAIWVIFKVLVSVSVILILVRLVDLLGARMFDAAEATESKLDDQLVPLMTRSLKIVVWVGGILFVLDNLEQDIWSVVAGLGIFGIGIALAMKDTLANLLGSITVFLDKPFQVGDWILVAGVEGTVEEVGFRSTRVRTFYNSVVSVPNSRLVDSVTDNMGRREFRRMKTTLGIAYDTPPETIEAFCQGVRELVLASPNMRHDYYLIYLNQFGAVSLDIMIYVFFKVPDWEAELRSRQNFMLEIIRLAGAMGVEFAFPTQTLHVASTPERPPAPPKDRPVDELDAIMRKYAKGGPESRPEGTPKWARDD